MGISNDRIEKALGRITTIRKNNFATDIEAQLEKVVAGIQAHPLSVEKEFAQLNEIYTAIAEYDKEIDGSELLNEFQERLVQAIFEHGEVLINHAKEMLSVIKEESEANSDS